MLDYISNNAGMVGLLFFVAVFAGLSAQNAITANTATKNNNPTIPALFEM